MPGSSGRTLERRVFKGSRETTNEAQENIGCGNPCIYIVNQILGLSCKRMFTQSNYGEFLYICISTLLMNSFHGKETIISANSYLTAMKVRKAT